MEAKNSNWKNIKSKHILKQIFNKLHKTTFLKIIKHNKYIQNIFGLELNDFKDCYEKIIIEIIPKQYLKYTFDENYFIRIKNNEEPYFHIYFDNDKEEIKRAFIKKNESVRKIKVIIDYEIKSFFNLFHNCEIIEKINIIQFNRKDINDMSYMFFGCSALKEINFSFIKFEKVKDIDCMFYGCSSLKKINNSYLISNNNNKAWNKKKILLNPNKFIIKKNKSENKYDYYDDLICFLILFIVVFSYISHIVLKRKEYNF